MKNAQPLHIAVTVACLILAFFVGMLCTNAQTVDTLEIPHESGKIEAKIVKREAKKKNNAVNRFIYDESKLEIQPVPSDDCVLTSVWKTPQSVIKLPVLGDGYTQVELTKHVNDVRDLSNKFFLPYPLNVYKNYFEMIAVSCPSQTSGAKHPGTAGDCYTASPAVPINTTAQPRYGATFDYGGTHRLLYCPNTSQIGTDLQRVPGYTKALLLVNTTHYGGSGGNYSIGSMHAQSAEIMIHEFGHSFAGLADEYGGAYCTGAERANVTQETDRTKIKWRHLIKSTTPIPTPAYTNCSEVGLHNGANYCNNGWYRSMCDCKMRMLGKEFCVVCASEFERIIKNYIGTPQPEPEPFNLTIEPTSATVNYGIGTTLTASGADTYEWRVGTENIATGNRVFVVPTVTTTYTVTGKKGTQTKTASVVVTVIPKPEDPTCNINLTLTPRVGAFGIRSIHYSLQKDALLTGKTATYQMERAEYWADGRLRRDFYLMETVNFAASQSVKAAGHSATKGVRYEYRVKCVELNCVKTFTVTAP